MSLQMRIGQTVGPMAEGLDLSWVPNSASGAILVYDAVANQYATEDGNGNLIDRPISEFFENYSCSTQQWPIGSDGLPAMVAIDKEPFTWINGQREMYFDPGGTRQNDSRPTDFDSDISTDTPLEDNGLFTGRLLVATQGELFHRKSQEYSCTSGTPEYWTVRVKEGTSGKLRINIRDITSGNFSRYQGDFGNLSLDGVTAGDIEVIRDIVLLDGSTEIHLIFTPNFTGDATFGIGPFSDVSGENVEFWAAQRRDTGFGWIFGDMGSTESVSVTNYEISSNLLSAMNTTDGFSLYVSGNGTTSGDVQAIVDAAGTSGGTHRMGVFKTPTDQGGQVVINAGVNETQFARDNIVGDFKLATRWEDNDVQIGVNGVVQTGGTGSTTATLPDGLLTSGKIGARAAGTDPYYGTLRTIAVFDTHLSDPDLLWRTESSLNFPKNLWLDASDVATVTETAGAVSQWDDKSGYDNHAVQATGANQPVYALTPNRLVFDKSDDNMSVSFSSDVNGTLIQASEEGIVVATVGISAGTWSFADQAAYFPSDNILELIISDGTLSSGTISAVKSYLTDKGAGSDFSGITTMSNWFRGRSDIVTLDTSNWDTSNVVSFSSFARGCSSLTKLDTSGWDVSNVTNFSVFADACSSLTSLGVSDWNTSGVTNFSYFARDCSSLTELDVSGWDTSSVVNFTNFIPSCSSLTELDVSGWDTRLVSHFSYFARSCSALTELDVSNWDTSSAVTFEYFAEGCSSLTELNVSNWDTSGVTSFSRFIQNCSSLTTVTVTGGTGNPFADSNCTDYTNAFINTNLTQQSIDDILVAINAAATSNGTFGQSGGSAPSSTGEAAIDALRSRGWTIAVTGDY